MTVLMADSGQLGASSIKADPWMDCPTKAGAYPNFHGIHQGFGNVCWVDGHVKAISPIYNDIISVSASGTATYGTLPGTYTSANLGNLDLTNRPAGQQVSDELFNMTGAP
jgi:prepilin-type processing-associated H-X9-DG protein